MVAALRSRPGRFAVGMGRKTGVPPTHPGELRGVPTKVVIPPASGDAVRLVLQGCHGPWACACGARAGFRAIGASRALLSGHSGPAPAQEVNLGIGRAQKSSRISTPT